jgi:hypothetical protein
MLSLNLIGEHELKVFGKALREYVDPRQRMSEENKEE